MFHFTRNPRYQNAQSPEQEIYVELISAFPAWPIAIDNYRVLPIPIHNFLCFMQSTFLSYFGKAVVDVNHFNIYALMQLQHKVNSDYNSI